LGSLEHFAVREYMSGSVSVDLSFIAQPEQIITGLFNSPLVGIAILDRRLRYQLVNESIAVMNGVPSTAHFGKTVPAILGDFADKVVPTLESVLESGQSTSNLEIGGKLQARENEGRWIENYFAIKNASGGVERVACVVVEMPPPHHSSSHPKPSGYLSPRSPQGRLVRQIQRVFDPLASPTRLELLRGLDERAVKTVLAAARHTTRYRGENFCRQGEPSQSFFLLTSGLAKIGRITDAGKEVLLGWANTGDVFGLGALAADPPSHLWNVSAANHADALEWDTQTISRFAESCPKFYANVLSIALCRVQELTERLEAVSTKGVEQRLAQLVLILAERSRENGPAELHTSDEELAQMTGTTLFTVNKTIRTWQRMGYVDKSRRRLLIVDIKSLLRISSSL
jgi:CRP-like cAMP-binding protein